MRLTESDLSIYINTINLKRLIMKTNHFFSERWLCFYTFMALATLSFCSCARDGFSPETFNSGVFQTQLTAIPADSISVVPATDGSKTVISWPVVFGASGYRVSVYDVTNSEKSVVVDSIMGEVIDGCTLAVKRAEDTNYRFVIQVLGNKKAYNTDAADSTTVTFTSFTPTYATIPSGTDLSAYFLENPVPSDTTNVNYNLEPGGQYTVSNAVDFGIREVTLRNTNKTDKAIVQYTSKEAALITAAPLTLKNIKFDCSTSSAPVIQLSKDAPVSLLGAKGSGSYYNIMGAVHIANCDFTGVQGDFLSDNSKMYCLETFLMDHCTVQTSTLSNMNGLAYFHFKSGFIKDITIRNSSWWNTGNTSMKYFIQYSSGGRVDRAGYNTSDGESVNFLNCSFYNICKSGQWCNYSGFSGRNYTLFDVESNIWVDCGNNQIPRRICGGRGASSYSTKCVFNNNTYWFNGAAETGNTSYDKGYQLQSDPAFEDPANGNLTPTGSEQVSKQTGDPRWFKEDEN
jgi:hypothetical protein